MTKPTSSSPTSEEAETERLFLSMLDERKSDRESAVNWRPVNPDMRREKKQLKQPVTRVDVDNIFTWHLNQHTVIENETDPELIKNRIWQRRVGVKESGRLTEAQIAAHEERLGIRLPLPWRDVYKHFNGGWVGTLFWGDRNNPQNDDIVPIPQSAHQYLALEDVAPLRDLLPVEWEELDLGRLDCSNLDPRLIAIACAGSQAVLLDYRQGTSPRVCKAFFSKYNDDPLAGWETDEFTFWWPNMAVFFRGLYLQNRAA
ncbi:SMI1/KNR4 family protein [Agrobacterium sp. lyk4-40-TYG-31]|uniref:SMI1/KNR4 family protein n=1 Tax=Agrobacterium sp. lyk4-40-TYG-31 TaxID=3040276 RepID=UPI0025509813|nr:SMI1/KNR4 family protein [Agrobacterium sp. lyk4-40-TYG-31]